MIARFIIVSLTLGTVLLAPSSGRSQDASQVTLDDIWTEFGARQASVQTAKVSWKYRFVKSAYSAADSLANEREDPGGAADIVFPERSCQFSLSGERVRYEAPIADFSHGQGGRPTSGITAFDGIDEQYFSESLRHDRPHSGSLRASDAFGLWAMIHIHALTYALRPLRPELFGPDHSQWLPVEGPAVIDGTECIVLEKPYPSDPTASPPNRIVDRVYLDPHHKYRLLRYTNLFNDSVVAQTDVRYDRHDDSDWLPTSWNTAMYGATTGKLLESSANQLTSVVLNKPILDEEFRITFPQGTQVRRIYTPYESQMYVARGNGQLVAVSPREQLNVPAPPETWRPSWGLIAVGIVLLALAITWGTWWRRRRA